jgi:energy-coupling factor transport system permease protein
VSASGLAVGAVGWWVARVDLTVAHPGVEAVPVLSATALAGLLAGLLPAVLAPPPARPLRGVRVEAIPSARRLQEVGR